MTRTRTKKPATTKKSQSAATNYQQAQKAIAALSLEELVRFKSDVEQLIKQKQKEQRKALHAKMLELAKAAGFKSVEEFVASQKGRSSRSDKGVRLPPKYRSKDGKKMWSGKGRVPNWVLEHEKNGGDREGLAIK